MRNLLKAGLVFLGSAHTDSILLSAFGFVVLVLLLLLPLRRWWWAEEKEIEEEEDVASFLILLSFSPKRN